MMVNFSCFLMSYVILMLLFTGSITASTRQQFTSITVRPGADVTLPCKNEVEENCVSSSWIFAPSERSPFETLAKPGRVLVPGSKSDRLDVPADCSLVLKEVTEEDVGRYSCRNTNKSELDVGKDALVQLSLIKVTEQKSDVWATLNCSVSTYGTCRHTVTWLYVNDGVNKDDKDLKVLDSKCSSSLTLKTSHLLYTTGRFLKCKVKEHHTVKEEVFPFIPQSSGKNKTEPRNRDTKPPPEDPHRHPQQQWWWWRYVLVAAVVLAVLSLAAVALVMWKRRNKTKMEENRHTGVVDPLLPPSAAPEDSVAYAAINHPSDISSQIRGGNDAVTYSTVNVSSTDHCNLYATVK